MAAATKTLLQNYKGLLSVCDYSMLVTLYVRNSFSELSFAC